MKQHRLIATAVISLFSGWAVAQSNVAPAPSGPPGTDPTVQPTASTTPARSARRDRDAAFNQEKAQLGKLLQGANEREEYIKVLQNNGYRIASSHTSGPNYLEYEVVRGRQSFEVQLDFEPGAHKASKIDVTPNMWRSESTTRMLADPNHQAASPMVVDTEGRFSDRRYMKGWTEERQKLEQALPAGLKQQDYKKRIEDLHYKIASVDDRSTDHLDYRIVKGDNSYQVQVGLDPTTKVAQSVEVMEDPGSADAPRNAEAAPTR